MSTYDYTKGAASGFFHQNRSSVWVPIDVDAVKIIASDTTLTTDEQITATDIIEIYDIPAGSVLTGWACLETITKGVASNTCDIGIEGTGQLFNGVALDAEVGTMLVVDHSSTWGILQGVSYKATSTLDMEFLTGDEDQGRWIVWIEVANLSKEGQVLGY